MDSADSQVIAYSDLRENLSAEFVSRGEFFVVIARKTAINSLITAGNLRFYRKCDNSLSAVRKLSLFMSQRSGVFR